MTADLARKTLSEEVQPALKEAEQLLSSASELSSQPQLEVAMQNCFRAIQAITGKEAQKGFSEVMQELTSTSNASGIRCTFQQSGPQPDWPSALDQELALVARETYQNAIKYASGSLLSFFLISSEKQMILSISDDGKGRNANTPNKGIGMKKLKRWIHSWGGSLQEAATEGGGLTLVLTFSLSEISSKQGDTPGEELLASLIHDDLCQNLTGLTLMTATLRDQTSSEHHEEWTSLRKVSQLFADLTAQCRSLAHQLNRS